VYVHSQWLLSTFFDCEPQQERCKIPSQNSTPFGVVRSLCKPASGNFDFPAFPHQNAPQQNWHETKSGRLSENRKTKLRLGAISELQI